MHSNPSSKKVSRAAALLRAASLASLILPGFLAPAAQTAPTNAPSAEVVIPKSVFVPDDAAGKDPFFPNSTRRTTRAPDDSNKQPVQQDFSQLLVLKGITGPPERRIALINNLTFTKDEEEEVKAGNTKVKIRVLEIRDKSVIINVEGSTAPKELMLQEKLLPLSE